MLNLNFTEAALPLLWCWNVWTWRWWDIRNSFPLWESCGEYQSRFLFCYKLLSQRKSWSSACVRARSWSLGYLHLMLEMFVKTFFPDLHINNLDLNSTSVFSEIITSLIPSKFCLKISCFLSWSWYYCKI